MTPSEQAVFAKLWEPVGALYGKHLTPTLLELYWQVLKPYPLRAIKQALTEHIQSPEAGTYFPKPADLLRTLDVSDAEQARTAWSHVLYALSHIGAYRSVQFEDRLIHAVIDDLGGWVALNTVNYEQLPFKARAFQQRYRDYKHHPPSNIPPLFGLLACHQPGERPLHVESTRRSSNFKETHALPNTAIQTTEQPTFKQAKEKSE